MCAVAPLAGFVAVQLYLRALLGGAGSSVTVQKLFGRALSWPWRPLLHDAVNLVTRPDTWLDFVTFPALVGCLGTFVLLWLYRRRFSPGKSLFIALILLSSLTLAWNGEPETISTLRYLFGAFPTAQLLALASQEKLPSKRATLYGAAAGFALFFVHSVFVRTEGFSRITHALALAQTSGARGVFRLAPVARRAFFWLVAQGAARMYIPLPAMHRWGRRALARAQRVDAVRFAVLPRNRARGLHPDSERVLPIVSPAHARPWRAKRFAGHARAHRYSPLERRVRGRAVGTLFAHARRMGRGRRGARGVAASLLSGRGV